MWALLLACHADPPAHHRPRRAEPEPEPRPPAVWPMAGTPLDLLAPRIPAGLHRVMIDPGHGAPASRPGEPPNDGNTGVLCQKEADEMLRIGGVVIDRLRHPGRLEVRSTRPGGAVTDYGERIREADAWGDVLISFHSDARSGTSWYQDPVTGCQHSEGAPGFAVLWSDEGEPALIAARKRLAWVVAARMREAGFGPFQGDYNGLYARDPDHPGVYLDRHEPELRIRMLRRPIIPSVIVETHNAPDPDDVARWREPGTIEAFASALRAAIVDYFTTSR